MLRIKYLNQLRLAKVSTSGEEARENNFLNFADGISVNPDHLLYDAKQAALALEKQDIKHLFMKKFL